MGQKVCDVVKNAIDNREKHIPCTKLAKVAGVSCSIISKFLSGDREPGFNTVVKVVRYLEPNNEYALMDKICLLFEGKANIRAAMEYASLHRRHDILDSLSNAPETNPQNIEWQVLHRLLLRYQLKTDDISVLYGELKEVKVRHEESKLLATIFESMLLYYLRHYTHMAAKVYVAEAKVDSLPSSGVKTALTLRIHELLSNIHLYVNNDVEKAREYAQRIINAKMCTPFIIRSYNIIGTSFLFESHSQATENYIKFREMAREHGRDELVREADNHALMFANTLWGEGLSEVCATSDELEMAHYESKWGDRQKAIKILENSDDKDCAYYACYRGVAEGNPDLLLESIKRFREKGNLYMAKLPIRYLQDYPDYYHVVQKLF